MELPKRLTLYRTYLSQDVRDYYFKHYGTRFHGMSTHIFTLRKHVGNDYFDTSILETSPEHFKIMYKKAIDTLNHEIKKYYE